VRDHYVVGDGIPRVRRTGLVSQQGHDHVGGEPVLAARSGLVQDADGLVQGHGLGRPAFLAFGQDDQAGDAGPYLVAGLGVPLDPPTPAGGVEAVQWVVAGKRVVDPSIVNRLVNRAGLSVLTFRERGASA